MDVCALLDEYSRTQPGQFCRANFLRWAAHHGLSRRITIESVDAAFLHLIVEGRIEQCQSPPAPPNPLYRRVSRR